MNRRGFFRCLSGLAALALCPIKPTDPDVITMTIGKSKWITIDEAMYGWQIISVDGKPWKHTWRMDKVFFKNYLPHNKPLRFDL